MAQNQELQNVFAYIDKNKNRIIAENIAICEIPAPTFHEEKRAAYLAKRIKKLGFKNAKIDKVGNVIARIPGRKPTIMLVAHMDTVFEDAKIEVKRKGDWLYGKGISDDASGITVLLYLLELINKGLLKIPNKLIFAFTAGEESRGNCKGMRYLMKVLGKAVDLVINIDSDNPKKIYCIGTWIEGIKVGLKAKGGHAWSDFGNPSAIHSAGKIIAEITKIKLPKKPRTICNVGVISGGSIVSAIAENAEMQIDLRSADEKELALLKKRVLGIVKRVAKKEKVVIKISSMKKFTGGVSARKNELIKIINAVMKTFGIMPEEGVIATDGNISIARGIPTVTISGPRSKYLHSKNEKLQISSAQKDIKLASAILKNFSEKWK